MKEQKYFTHDLRIYPNGKTRYLGGHKEQEVKGFVKVESQEDLYVFQIDFPYITDEVEVRKSLIKELKKYIKALEEVE